MDLSNLENGDIVMLCVVVSGMLLTLGVVMLLRPTLRLIIRWLMSVMTSTSRTARGNAAELGTVLAELRALVKELAPYEVDYHHAFSQVGWPELQQQVHSLGEAEQRITALIEEGYYRDAVTLTSFLLDQLSEHACDEAATHFPEFESLRGWNARVHSTLVSMIDAVHTAASENRSLGIQPSRERRPTLETLAELREILRTQ